MTPRQARAARAMLGLTIKDVCAKADIGKRTLTEFETGARTINAVTTAKIVAFYIAMGLSFTEVDGEGVKIASHDSDVVGPPGSVRAKIEHTDIFAAAAVQELLATLNHTIGGIEQRSIISRAILLHVMKRHNLNQADVAKRLGVTNSFLSAVVTGKKTLSVKHGPALCDYIAGFNPSSALANEKLIKKYLSEMNALARKLSDSWGDLQGAWVFDRSAP